MGSNVSRKAHVDACALFSHGELKNDLILGTPPESTENGICQWVLSYCDQIPGIINLMKEMVYFG